MSPRAPSIQTAALSAALLALSFRAGSTSFSEESTAPPSVPDVVRAKAVEVLDDEARLWMTVYGETNRVAIVGEAANGEPSFVLNTAADEQPVLTPRNCTNGEVRFER